MSGAEKESPGSERKDGRRRSPPGPATTNLIRQRIVPTADRNVCSRFIRIRTSATRRMTFSALVHRTELQPPDVVRCSRAKPPETVGRGSRTPNRSAADRRVPGESPAGQELAVIAARVRQAEAQPDHGKEGLDDECARQPVDRPPRSNRAQAEAREHAVDAECRSCPRRSTTRQESASCEAGWHTARSRLKNPAAKGRRKRAVTSNLRLAERLCADVHALSWRRNHNKNKNSGTSDSTKKMGPPRRWMMLSIMCGPTCTQSSPMTRIRNPFRTIASGITKATSTILRHGLSRKRWDASRLVMKSTHWSGSHCTPERPRARSRAA